MNFCVLQKRCRPLCMVNDQLLVSHLGKLYLLNPILNKKSLIADLPYKKLYRILVKIRLLERLLRLEPRAAINIDNRFIDLVCKGAIYRLDTSNLNICKEHEFRSGMSAPLVSGLTKIENLYGFENCIVYGEYWRNVNREEVSVYSKPYPSGEWSKAYTFPPGSIRHIHAIIPDHYKNKVYILTGDDDKECGFWAAEDNFRSVYPIMTGQQEYRSCVAHVYPEKILFATDMPGKINAAYWMNINESNQVSVDLITKLSGSCIYSIQMGNTSILSTTVEFDNELPGWRTWFTYKRGKGIQTWNCEVIAIQEYQILVLAEFKKDIWPMKLFQYAYVHFCRGTSDQELYIYPIGVRHYDGNLIKINL